MMQIKPWNRFMFFQIKKYYSWNYELNYWLLIAYWLVERAMSWKSLANFVRLALSFLNQIHPNTWQTDTHCLFLRLTVTTDSYYVDNMLLLSSIQFNAFSSQALILDNWLDRGSIRSSPRNGIGSILKKN